MEIELYSKLQDPVSAIEKIGRVFAKSGMFGCQKEEQGQVLAMICLSERKSPVQLLKTYHIVDGNLSKKALAALAEFRQNGGKHRWLKSGDDATAKEDDRYAELELTDKEQNKTTYRYSMADAKAEGLVRKDSRWTKRPGNMLRARCITNGLGMLCPEIFAGEDEQEASPPQAEPLLPEKKPEPKPVVQTENVVDVQAEVVQPAAPAPEATAPAPRVYTVADLQVSADTGCLTIDAMAAIESVIGEANMPKLVQWLKKVNWIKADQGLSNLGLDRAKRIFEKPAVVLETISKE